MDERQPASPVGPSTKQKSPARSLSSAPTSAAELPAASTTDSSPAPSAPVLGDSFPGAAECCSIPPDPIMAVGPHQVVIATNDGYQAFQKNGTPVPNTATQPCAGSCQLFTFFSNAGIVSKIFDPWLLYDQYISRYWFLVVSSNDSPRKSDFLIALSNSDDILDGWTLFGIDARTNGDEVQAQWCDYPKLGIDAQAIYLTCNMFSFPTDDATFQYAKIRVMTKTQFLENTCCYWFDWWDLHEFFAFVIDHSFSIQPAHSYGATDGDGMYLINAMNECALCPPQVLWVRHITNPQVCCVPGNQHEPNKLESLVLVGGMEDPPGARQLDTTTRIDAGDNRLLNAVWQGGHLSTVQTIKCPNSNNACAAFTELDVSSFPGIDIVTDMYVPPEGFDRYFPSVDTNAAGNKTVVYTRSSSSEYAGAYFVGIPNSDQCTDCLDGPETVLQQGLTSYVSLDNSGVNRWGDYFGSAADPDGTGIWIHGEFAQISPNQWATMVGLTYEFPDATPPTTTAALAPVPTGFGWNNTSVTVTLNATDIGSGVRRITYSASGAQTIPTTVVAGASTSFTISAEGETTVSFFAEDNWGNVEAERTQLVRIDRVAPVVSCGIADGLWHATDVSIACTATDALSGLANSADASFSLATSVPIETETNNACTGTRAVPDRANNSTTAGPVCGNKVDKKAPTISITTPPLGAVYLLNQSVPTSYSCLDGGSGIATCAGPVASGGPIDTSSVGTKTFTVVATDNVGNTRSLSVTYVVTYKVCLLYDPDRPFAGNAVPIRIALCDVNDVNVSSPDVVLHATVVDPGAIPATSTVNPTNDFIYYAGLGGYTYILSTTGYAPGSYELRFTVTGDPVTHSAPFRLR